MIHDCSSMLAWLVCLKLEWKRGARSGLSRQVVAPWFFRQFSHNVTDSHARSTMSITSSIIYACHGHRNSLPAQYKPRSPHDIGHQHSPPTDIRTKQCPRTQFARDPQPIPISLPRTPAIKRAIIRQYLPHQPHSRYEERNHKHHIRKQYRLPLLPCKVAQIPS